LAAAVELVSFPGDIPAEEDTATYANHEHKGSRSYGEELEQKGVGREVAQVVVLEQAVGQGQAENQ
jgi:hypothetical protein